MLTDVGSFSPITLALFIAIMALLPVIVVMTTSFLKISVVAMLLRNALGVQQIPPNIAIYSISLIMTVYVLGPVFQHMITAIQAEPQAMQSTQIFIETALKASNPLRDFLVKNTKPEQIEFFLAGVKQLWPAEMAASVTPRDFLIVIPAFLITELTSAFEIGFLLYLPFIVIDLIVQSVLLALGMMMMSPMTISLPFKLLLFVMADGWTRLYHALVMSYI